MLHFDRCTAKHALQNTQNDCHQWLPRSFRVQQIRPGLGPGPRWGAYDAPQAPSWFKGTLLLRGRGEGRVDGPLTQIPGSASDISAKNQQGLTTDVQMNYEQLRTKNVPVFSRPQFLIFTTIFGNKYLVKSPRHDGHFIKR